MKTVEEKAKRYDAAIEELRGLLEGIHEEKCEIMEEDIIDIFPELKESEDEKVRKEIYSALKYLETELGWDAVGDVDILDAYAWLEKQDKQKPICLLDNSKSNVKFPFKAKVKSNGKIVTIHGGQLSMDCKEWIKYQSDVKDGYMVYKPEDLELVCNSEQKPVIEMITPEESLGIDSETYNEIVNACIFGKNKPKFKVGDWIVTDKGDAIQISAANPGYYTLNNGMEFSTSYVDKYWKPWTIQDAKPGDVLAIDPWSDYPSSFVAIYKKQNDFDTFDSYCFVGFNEKFYEGECGHSTENIHPATKEQHELLFKNMKEEGYEWDADKKELKKINEQHLISNYFKAEYERGKADALKSVVWNEEDEERIKNILSVLDAQVCWDGATGKKGNPYQKEINWLKSFKDRYTWKPSDKQMHAFKQVYDWYNNDFAQSETLTSLYDDLMKLKG